MQISIKPICDCPIYLTASADERLACIMQTSFHSTTSFMNPILATVAQNRIIANFFLHTPHLSLPPYLSHYNFFFPVFIFKPFTSNPDFHFTILSCRLSSLCAIKIKSSAYSNSRGKPARSSRNHFRYCYEQ